MPAPCTVIKADPVPALLPRRATLSPATSTDQPWLMLALRSPTLMTVRRVPPPPCPIRHRTDVSDSQSVDSHEVMPSLLPVVYPTVPILAPCTVIDADPDPALFPCRITLVPPISDVHPCVMLPARLSPVITSRRVPLALCPTRHLTEVSDAHSVLSQPVSPARPLVVYPNTPMLAPCTVATLEPVLAWFPITAILNTPTSTDHPWLMLFPCWATVMTARPLA